MMAVPMWILFLDLDGVLLHDNMNDDDTQTLYTQTFGPHSDDKSEEHLRYSILMTRKFAKAPLAALEEFLLQEPKVNVVLSSSWRLDKWDKFALERLFVYYPWLAKRMIGCTPGQNDSKGKSILAWIEQHQPTHWVVLDDRYIHGIDDSHMVKVDVDQLLTVDNMKRASQLLHPDEETKCAIQLPTVDVSSVVALGKSLLQCPFQQGKPRYWEGQVETTLDQRPWMLHYYWNAYDSQHPHLELCIATDPKALQGTMFVQGKHKWSQIALLLDIQFKEFEASLDTCKPELCPFAWPTLMAFVDAVCMGLQIHSCQRSSFPLPVELQGWELTSVEVDMTRLLHKKPLLGQEYGYTLPLAPPDEPNKTVQSLFMNLETQWTLDKVDKVLQSGDSRAALDHGYRSRSFCYEATGDDETLQILLKHFDQGLKHWNEWVQEYKQGPSTRSMTLAGFLRWCWNCCPSQFQKMYHFLHPTPAYTDYGTVDGKNGWPWARDLHLLWMVICGKRKLFSILGT